MTETPIPAYTGRIALVTGASRGLGFALSLALARQGWHILAVGRTVGGLEELDDRIREAGGSATLAPLDVTDAGAMDHLTASALTRWGGLGLWVHTAIHASPLQPAALLDLKDFDRSLACNVRATAVLIHLVDPLLRAGGGQAVFLDDPHAGDPFFGDYGATKAAQMALARSWQAETAAHGPKVSILTPRPCATALRARFFPGEDRTRLAGLHDEAERLVALI
jgi:NAD(P)-dependent dehydrogenase (short-subunit alcohol dehydrogenase family)